MIRQVFAMQFDRHIPWAEFEDLLEGTSQLETP
jgi:hypothetical protein